MLRWCDEQGWKLSPGQGASRGGKRLAFEMIFWDYSGASIITFPSSVEFAPLLFRPLSV